MKKMLFRKFFADYMSFFLIAVLSSSIVIWVFQAVNYLDIMIEDGRDYTVYLSYSILNFPKIINKLFPFVLFFSLFHLISKYENNNELIIFWNFGINKMELINFIFKSSLLLMLIQIALSSFVVPKSQSLARSFLKNSTVNFFGNFIKPRIFNDTIKNVTIYTEKKDINGNLYNLYLKKELDQNNFQVTYAKKGVFKEINNIPVLVLYDGATITGKNNDITNFSFSKSDFPLNNLDTNTTTYTKTQELSSVDILKCIHYLFSKKIELVNEIKNCSKKNLANINKELYKRFIIPFYIPLLMLVPFILLISSKENVGYSKLRVFTFFTGLVIIIFSETTIRLISQITLKNFTISLMPIFLLTTLYLILLKKNNFNYLMK